MEVLEQLDRRLAPALRAREALRELHELTLPCLGVHGRRSPGRVGNAEEVEEDRQRFGEALVEAQCPARNLVARRLVVVLLGDPEVVPVEIDPGEEGDHLPVRRRVPFREADAARPAALGELVAEPALPDAGISRDPDDLARACEGAGERRLERLHLLVAADETREATRP